MSSEPFHESELSARPQLEFLSDLLDEFRARIGTGSPFTVEEFIEEHSEFATELRNLLPVAEVLAGLSGQAISRPSSDSPAIDPLTGTLGDFRLLRELGRGGMGIVYEAEQISLGRRVAVKVFPFAALLDSRQLERFKTEARTAAMLQHPNIVKVLSVGSDRGVHFYAMELIRGQSLARFIDQIREAPSMGRRFA